MLINYDESLITDQYDRSFQLQKKEFERAAEMQQTRRIFKILGITAICLLIFNLILGLVLQVQFYDPSTKQPKTYQPYVTIDIVVLGIVLLFLDLPTDVIFLTIDFLLILFGCLSFQEAVAGFSNQGALKIVFLSIVSHGINETRALDVVFKRVLGNETSISKAQTRLFVCIFFLSGFVTSNALVGILIPLIQSFCLSQQMPVQQFLLPLSIAAILGSCLSIIGSPITIISFQLVEQNPLYTEGHFGFFEIAIVGLPVGLAGLAYVLITSRYILQHKSQGSSSELKNQVEINQSEDPDKGYWVVLQVFNIHQKTVAQLGLHNTFLSKLKVIVKATSHSTIQGTNMNSEVLEPGDLLVYFCFSASGVTALRQYNGFNLSVFRLIKRLGEKRRHRVLFELVVAKKSNLDQRTLREVDFLYRYDACVISVKRKDIGICRYSYDSFKLKAGDVLLVEAPAAKDSIYRYHQQFSLCSVVPQSKPPRFSSNRDFARQVTAGILFVVMVVLSATRVLNIGVSAFLLGIVFLLNKTLTVQEAKRVSNVTVYLIIAGSVGMSDALQKSGVLYQLGLLLIDISIKGGGLLVLVVIYLSILLLSLVLSGSSTAILMIPVALEAAKRTGLSQKMFVFGIIFAACQDLMFPISQTNLMIARHGKYKFCDFVRFGLPLTSLLMLLTIPLVYYAYG